MINSLMMKVYLLSSNAISFSRKKKSRITPLKNQLKNSYSLRMVISLKIENGLCSETFKKKRIERFTQSKSFLHNFKRSISTSMMCTCLLRLRLPFSILAITKTTWIIALFSSYIMHFLARRTINFIWWNSLLSICWMLTLSILRGKIRYQLIDWGPFQEKKIILKCKLVKFLSFSSLKTFISAKITIFRSKIFWFAKVSITSRRLSFTAYIN